MNENHAEDQEVRDTAAYAKGFAAGSGDEGYYQRRIAELERAMLWQPIETAPKDTWILVYVHWVGVVRQARLNTVKQGKKGWKVCYGADQPMCVQVVPSHWMPLPEPPNE